MYTSLFFLAVAIPGVLSVEGIDRTAPSHGGESQILLASYQLRNETGKPLSVELQGCYVRPVATTDGDAQKLRLQSVSIDGRVAKSTQTIVLPPSTTVRLDLRAAPTVHARYHVTYLHECDFAAADKVVRAQTDHLYFRQPLRRN